MYALAEIWHQHMTLNDIMTLDKKSAWSKNGRIREDLKNAEMTTGMAEGCDKVRMRIMNVFSTFDN